MGAIQNALFGAVNDSVWLCCDSVSGDLPTAVPCGRKVLGCAGAPAPGLVAAGSVLGVTGAVGLWGCPLPSPRALHGWGSLFWGRFLRLELIPLSAPAPQFNGSSVKIIT